nr:PDZ domain-containing protein [Deltaproteobacteria bacterium]
MNGTRALVALVVVAVAGCGGTQAPTPPTAAVPDAAAIMRTMAATYLAATSYVDRGMVTTVFIEGARRKTHTKTFATALVRPNQFRFEFREGTSPRAYVVWSDGARTYAQLTQPGTIDHGPDLGLALAGATGISSGAAHTVPRLLLPEVVGGVGLTELRDVRLAGSESVDGHPCWRLTGQLRDATMTLWVDQATHLLRRTFWPHHVAGPRPFTAEQTTTYDPIINRPVATAALAPPDLAGHAPTVVAQPPTPPWVGIRFDPDGSTRVRTVIPGAPAERAGVKAGDDVVSIAGTPVRAASEFIAKIRSGRSGVALAIVVSRAGAELRLDVTPER